MVLKVGSHNFGDQKTVAIGRYHVKFSTVNGKILKRVL
jgi:hypothetical protein